jgi:hypothetical protein
MSVVPTGKSRDYLTSSFAVYSCDLTFKGKEEREDNNYFAKFYRKKMK